MCLKEFNVAFSSTMRKKYNNVYTSYCRIKNEEDLRKVAKFDNAPCKFKDFRRLNENFTTANVLFADLDNGHSERRETWFNKAQMFAIFKDVGFYWVPSFHHLKVKDGFPAREKYHIYFPIGQDLDFDAYVEAQTQLYNYFPALDEHFKTPCQCLMSVTSETTPDAEANNYKLEWHDGKYTILEFLATNPHPIGVQQDKIKEATTYDIKDIIPTDLNIECELCDIDIVELLQNSSSKYDVKPTINGHRHDFQHEQWLKRLKAYGITKKALKLWLGDIYQCVDWEWLCSKNEGKAQIRAIYRDGIKYYVDVISKEPGYKPPKTKTSKKREKKVAEVAPAEVAPAEVAPAEVAPAEVAPAEVAPAEVAPADEKVTVLDAKELPPPTPPISIKTFKIVEQNLINLPAETVFTVIYPAKYNKQGKLTKPAQSLPSQYQNTCDMLKFLKIKVKFNLLSKKNEFFWDDIFVDASETYCRTLIYSYTKVLKYEVGKEVLNEHISVLGQQNAYNPVMIYLKNCECEAKNQKIDLSKQENINKLWDCLEIKGEDNPIYKTLFLKWLVQTYEMAYNVKAEYSAQGVLVLQSRQNLGKTRLVQWLGSQWSKEAILLGDFTKDEISAATSFWIVELGEFGGTLQTDKLNQLKNFITSRSDTYRPPYGRENLTFPRLTSYIGTINEEAMLKDSTGDRRYWVIPLENIKKEYEDINLNLLWAEVGYLAQEGTIKPYLDDNEFNALQESNKQFESWTPEEAMILEGLDWELDVVHWNLLSALEVCKLLDIQNTKMRTVGRALHRIMMHNAQVEYRRTPTYRKYLLPPKKIDLIKQNEDNPYTNK